MPPRLAPTMEHWSMYYYGIDDQSFCFVINGNIIETILFVHVSVNFLRVSISFASMCKIAVFLCDDAHAIEFGLKQHGFFLFIFNLFVDYFILFPISRFAFHMDTKANLLHCYKCVIENVYSMYNASAQETKKFNEH